MLNSSTGRFISMTDSAANELVGTQATISARPFQAMNNPTTAPADGDRQRLGQQLPHDADPSGAERRAHGELLLAVRPAHEQQDRDVGAAHEQQRRHGAEQQKSLGPIGRANSSTMLRRCTRNVSG